MKPLTQNQLKNFIRYPKSQPKIFSPKTEIKPMEKTKPIPIPAELPNYAKPKDNYRTNKYITDRISNFEQSRKELLASPQQSPAKQRSEFDPSRDQSHPNKGPTFDHDPTCVIQAHLGICYEFELDLET